MVFLNKFFIKVNTEKNKRITKFKQEKFPSFQKIKFHCILDVENVVKNSSRVNPIQNAPLTLYALMNSSVWFRTENLG